MYWCAVLMRIDALRSQVWTQACSKGSYSWRLLSKWHLWPIKRLKHPTYFFFDTPQSMVCPVTFYLWLIVPSDLVQGYGTFQDNELCRPWWGKLINPHTSYFTKIAASLAPKMNPLYQVTLANFHAYNNCQFILHCANELKSHAIESTITKVFFMGSNYPRLLILPNGLLVLPKR